MPYIVLKTENMTEKGAFMNGKAHQKHSKSDFLEDSCDFNNNSPSVYVYWGFGYKWQCWRSGVSTENCHLLRA